MGRLVKGFILKVGIFSLIYYMHHRTRVCYRVLVMIFVRINTCTCRLLNHLAVLDLFTSLPYSGVWRSNHR